MVSRRGMSGMAYCLPGSFLLLCRSLIKSKLIPVLGGSEEEEDADAENADPLPEKLRGSVVRSVYIWPDNS